MKSWARLLDGEKKKKLVLIKKEKGRTRAEEELFRDKHLHTRRELEPKNCAVPRVGSRREMTIKKPRRVQQTPLIRRPKPLDLRTPMLGEVQPTMTQGKKPGGTPHSRNRNVLETR